MPPLPLTPAQRTMRAKIAANKRWGNSDIETRLETTKAGRDAAHQKFVDMVDPDRKLGEAERAMLVRNAKRAHFQQLAFRRSRARQARAGGEA